MKHWKALLIALVVLVLTFACTAALAEEAKEVDPKTCHHELEWKVSKEATCTEKGERIQVCTICGTKFASSKQEIPATGHTAAETKDSELSVAASCTKNGKDVYLCEVCGKVAKEVTVKATGHDIVGQPWVRMSDPTCAKAGLEARLCKNANCDAKDKMVETREIAKLTGDKDHKWVTIDQAVAATCTKAGKTAVEQCTVCKAYKGGKEVKALGHKWGKATVVAATCTVNGSSTKVCETCGKEDVTVLKATGHKKAWKVTVKATPTSDGEKVQYCKNCGLVFDTRKDPYTRMLYQNNVTGFGPQTKELIGGKAWERITPIDLSVEGKKTFDLIASNAYVVGSATVEIADGKLTVSYDVAKCVDVRKEKLTIYANTAALADPAEDTAKTFKYGEAIDIAENFGEDNIVLLGIHLIADYDQIGQGVTPFRPAQSDIAALKELAD